MKKTLYRFITIFVFVLVLSFFTITSYGNNVTTINEEQFIKEQTTQGEIVETTVHNEDDIISTLKMQELEQALAINEKLFGIYETWTAVISVVLILVSVISIVIPLYNNKIIDKKIEKAISNLKEESNAINQKQISINNALMLSASKDYSTSNVILNKLLQENKEDVYLHLLAGRNAVLEYVLDIPDYEERQLNEDEIEEVEKAVEHYLFVANNSKSESEYFELGAIFSDSIIHELCMLICTLIDYSMEHEGVSNYHKLTVKVLKAIEKMLGIKDFDDIVNEEQSNVHIMNYIGLNHTLAKSYMHFGNAKAKKQFEYALELYSIDPVLNCEHIGECKKIIESLESTNGV